MYKVKSKTELRETIEWLSGYLGDEKLSNSIFEKFIDELIKMEEQWGDYDNLGCFDSEIAFECSDYNQVHLFPYYFDGYLSDIVITHKKTNESIYIQKINYESKSIDEISDEFIIYILEGLSSRKLSIKKGQLYPRYVFERLPHIEDLCQIADTIYMSEGVAIELNNIFEMLGLHKKSEYKKYAFEQMLNTNNFGSKKYENKTYTIYVHFSKGCFKDYLIRHYKKDYGTTTITEYLSRNWFKDDYSIGLAGLPVEDAAQRCMKFFEALS